MTTTTPPPPMVLPIDSIDLSHYSVGELSSLRNRINALLPKSSLEDIDLMDELVVQFQAAKDLAALEDGAPLNQRAQTMNTILSYMKQLAELQKSMFSAARLQAFERTLAQTLKAYPDIQDEFYRAYTAALSQTAPENGTGTGTGSSS